MTRELRRLLIPSARLRQALVTEAGPQLRLEQREIHYLRRVLRCRSGDRLAVVDGEGGIWTARLAGKDQLRLQQPLACPEHRAGAETLPLGLALAIPRREADLVWRMATELGADRLQPLLAEHGVVQGALPLERWTTITTEASEQCERLWLPTWQAPMPAVDWLAARPPGLALLATPRQTDAIPLAALLRDGPAGGEPPAVTLAIGPEGGWSRQEEAVARDAGWTVVSLGNSILRTSTAAVAAVAVLSGWRSLSRASCPWPSP
jgi:16S rRNA (uracil1498-N3)-methyltransferase